MILQNEWQLHDLLVDYSSYYAQSFLEDCITDLGKSLQDPLGGDTLNFPLGNAYYFCVKEKENFFDKLLNKEPVKNQNPH
jgi:hypothetical protein